MAKNTDYWFEPESSKEIIKDLEKEYSNIVAETLKLAENLKNSVCKDNEWCDENAMKFGEWWTQSIGTGGELRWDEEKGLVIVNGASEVDGEDRIKRVVQEVGKTFWISVCRTLNGLSEQYSSQIKEGDFKKYYKAANDPEYKSTTEWRGIVWSDMMADDFNISPKYKRTALEMTYPKNAVSNTANINKMVTAVEANLKNIELYIENFVTALNKLIYSKEGEYWGFSEKDRQKIIDAAKELIKVSTKRLSDFQTCMNAALKATIENTEAAIDTLNLTFDVETTLMDSKL